MNEEKKQGLVDATWIIAAGLTLLLSMHQANGSDRGRMHDPQDAESAASVQLTRTPDVEVDGTPALRVIVFDAESDQPIPEFRVVLGVDVGEAFREPEFIERHGDAAIVNWQTHTARIGNDGEFLRSLVKAYNPLGIRVEADGYVPARYTWIDKGLGAQTIVFKLLKDSGIEGQAVLSDGSPAAGAKIGVALVQRGLRLQGDSFEGFDDPLPERPGDRWRRPTMVEADLQGRFVLPTETDPAAAVVAVHEEGICEMFFKDFREQPLLEMQAWGRVEGKVLVEDEPGVNEKVSIGTQRHFYGYPGMVSWHVETTSDEEGNFAVTKVPPGLVQISLFEYFPKSRPDEPVFGGGFRPIPANAYRHLEVESGAPTTVAIGGTGLGPKQIPPGAKVLISIGERGELLLDGKATTQEALGQLAANSVVTIRAHPEADYSAVVAVMDNLSEAGVTDVSLVTVDESDEAMENETKVPDKTDRDQP